MKAAAFFLSFSIAILFTGRSEETQAVPDKDLLSRSVVEEQIERLKEVEHRSESDMLIKFLREMLEVRWHGESTQAPVSIPEQDRIQFFGDRLGAPDPWAKIPLTRIHGRKVRAIAIHVDLRHTRPDMPEAPGRLPLPERIQQLKKLTEQPEWKDLVLDSFATSRGVLMVVPVAELPAIEHRLQFPPPDKFNDDLFPAGIEEGEIRPMKELLLDLNLHETAPIPIEKIRSAPQKFEGQRVTIAGLFTPHDEGTWANSEPRSLGLYLDKAWRSRILLRSGEFRWFREINLGIDKETPEAKAAFNDDVMGWLKGWPTYMTGRVHIYPRDDEGKGLRKDEPYLELEVVRETTREDPVWKAAQEMPKSKAKKK